ncbi:alpha-N-arabinofuranosidase [Lewinella marina]|uniref:non-reducing end alpha-L-arabinofuranosidase n=1 Tax=Neolewinella marina TaxID=438751 RepID=A0A2G0CAX8_9BACT|nr:alpha-L-arabinofuranosidase C-terminal domain-containing protein [Neolewinella marina]NJB84277.1 alpha-N-arabinofuranosidase [Neolewinella marina]PHK97139.1 alpha-L-arabinofuranosidase [Neolewinella marina]
MRPLLTACLLLLFLSGCSPRVLTGQSDARTLELNAATSVAAIQPTMYGIFFEDINFAADGGLYAEMVKNRSFEFTLPKTGWLEPQTDQFSLNARSGKSDVIKTGQDQANVNFLRVTVKGPDYVLINEGFRGMGVKVGAEYDLTFDAAVGDGSISEARFELIDTAGSVLGATSVKLSGSDWKEYSGTLKSGGTAAKARLRISFQGTGVVDLDMISLFPRDTWKGRKKGLRKDLVQLLDDMDPGFLRFPGGCIVEGRTLARRYQWKKTVGPVAEREYLVNRWNTEFNHRPTPDYYQSFGLGFFEYFQLAEDMGAEPLPILSCGMACQFNTGELVPLDELDPYVQDALDLIEFANGDVSTPWGKVRRDMGHPEPFNLKYIGVGNEQWGPEYIERYKVFNDAIKEAYPDIVIVSGSGPFPDGEFFEYGMEQLTALGAELVDEHYYRSPEWFRENATRYDNYDRSGPKIFAGEYAAQSVAIASPDNKNNWNTALSEAAYMTGMERNADLVVMTSYAPLMAHADAWQWTPDMIWFNNLESYGTANYYVQKLYANHAGTDLLTITEGGQPLTGQRELYASAVKDAGKNEIYLKVANTGTSPQRLTINIKGAKPGATVTVLTMASDDLEAVNSFTAPTKLSPAESTVALQRNQLDVEVPSHAFVVYKLKL